MGSYKDQWFANMERRLNDLLDKGVPEDKAYEQASNDAFEITRDQLADLADRERKRMKGE